MPDATLGNVISVFVFSGVAAVAWTLGAWLISKALR